MASKEQNEKIREFYKTFYNKSFTDPEIEEIHLSLFFLARAIHRFRLLQKEIDTDEKE